MLTAGASATSMLVAQPTPLCYAPSCHTALGPRATVAARLNGGGAARSGKAWNTISAWPASGGRSMSRIALRMAGQPGGDQDSSSAAAGVLQGVNNGLVRTMITGEAVVLAAAAIASVVFRINPLSGFSPSAVGAAIAAAAAVPIFIASVALERSNIQLFKEIDRDTQLFVVQLFGAKRDVFGVFPAAVAMSAAAAIAEELLFRGVLQSGLSGYVTDIPALVIASLLFGLAHNPVPGTSSLVEAVYGLTFGLVYLATGNLFAPILCHFLYDLATFIEVHLRATSNIGVAAGGVMPQQVQQQRQQAPQQQRQQQQRAAPAQARGQPQPQQQQPVSAVAAEALKDARVRNIVGRYKLPQPFLENAVGVFKMLDLDGNGSLDKRELQLGIRTFGRFTNDGEIDEVYAAADLNKDGLISFDEFLKLLADAVIQRQQMAASKR